MTLFILYHYDIINSLISFSIHCIGLVRGIDPSKKVFYITTPEEDHCVLRDVNCIVLGNTENTIDIVSQCHCSTFVPYLKHHPSLAS